MNRQLETFELNSPEFTRLCIEAFGDEDDYVPPKTRLYYDEDSHQYIEELVED